MGFLPLEDGIVNAVGDVKGPGRFANHLCQNTVAGGQKVTKEVVMAYKQSLLEKGYAVRSINSMLASLNSFLDFQGWQDCKVKSLKLQNSVYCPEEKELTKAEYLRLLAAAERQPRLRAAGCAGP